MQDLFLDIDFCEEASEKGVEKRQAWEEEKTSGKNIIKRKRIKMMRKDLSDKNLRIL